MWSAETTTEGLVTGIATWSAPGSFHVHGSLQLGVARRASALAQERKWRYVQGSRVMRREALKEMGNLASLQAMAPREEHNC